MADRDPPPEPPTPLGPLRPGEVRAPLGWLPRNPPAAKVELRRPFGGLIQRTVNRLSTAELRPVIRLAHRWPARSLTIPERIIFDHELVLVVRGEGELVTPLGPRRYGPRSLLFIPPFLPHEFRGIGSAHEHIAVHFDFAPRFPPPSDDPPRRSPYEVVLTGGWCIPDHAALPAGDPRYELMEALVEAWAAATELGTLQAEIRLMDVIVRSLERGGATAARATAEDVGGAGRIRRVLERMQTDLAKPLRVAALAREAGLGATQFKRLFREWTGGSPAAYLRQARLARACTLLRETDEPIKAVALGTGFRDPGHFSRLFRAVYRQWPTEYRAAVRSGRG